MFAYDKKIKKINFFSFNTNNIINAYNMLYRCKSLKELNVSNFNTKNIEYAYNIFKGCPKSLKIIVN